jgi:TolA-binding protein
MADLVRQSEENGNRLRGVEAGIGQLKNDEDQRIATLEQRIAASQTAAPVQGVQGGDDPAAVPSSPSRPRIVAPGRLPPKTAPQIPTTGSVAEAVTAGDPGEDAYTQGFHQWEAGQYDQAITTLKAFTAAYPKHKRISYANNLIGRAMLDKGDARGAATALLANYRSNPGGERAPDSLYYLGQALMKLGQPAQACKAYAELDAVYGAKIRPDLKKLETDGKAQAQCS